RPRLKVRFGTPLAKCEASHLARCPPKGGLTLKRLRTSPVLASLLLVLFGFVSQASADGVKKPLTAEDVQQNLGTGVKDAKVNADSAWMLVSTALVMLMVPGLALFYGGMVRRKNVLATMMQSMVALAVVGVYWVAVGYSLAFGDPIGESQPSFLGWSSGLFFLQGVSPKTLLPNT